MSTPSQVILAICVFLFLTPGDALICKKCIKKIAGMECSFQTCEAEEGGTCYSLVTLENGAFRDQILGCATKDICQSPPKQNGLSGYVDCCDDSDFCNVNF